MRKRTLATIGYSILITIIAMAAILLTKNILLVHLVHTITTVRGTPTYGGEERGTEVWDIVVGMILPAIFLLTLIIVFFARRKIAHQHPVEKDDKPGVERTN
jgi:hypothetical protein